MQEVCVSGVSAILAASGTKRRRNHLVVVLVCLDLHRVSGGTNIVIGCRAIARTGGCQETAPHQPHSLWLKFHSKILLWLEPLLQMWLTLWRTPVIAEEIETRLR
jgi:hypothetical protein